MCVADLTGRHFAGLSGSVGRFAQVRDEPGLTTRNGWAKEPGPRLLHKIAEDAREFREPRRPAVHHLDRRTNPKSSRGSLTEEGVKYAILEFEEAVEFVKHVANVGNLVDGWGFDQGIATIVEVTHLTGAKLA